MKILLSWSLVLTIGALISFVCLWSVEAQSQQTFVQQLANAGTSTFQAAPTGSDALQNPEIDPAVDVSDDGTGSTLSGTGSVVSNRTIGSGLGQGPSVNSGKPNPIQF